MLPRYELNAKLPERGTDLILKYEWRPNQRPVSTLRPYLSIRVYTKSPRLLPPSGVGKPGAFSRYPLQRYPLMLKRLLFLGCFVAGEHRCGCGQFGAGHECGAEGCELACVAFGYAEQGEQLGG